MRTNVEIKEDDHQYNEFKAGEHGYIDGYIRGGDNRPYAVVVIGDRLVLVNTYNLLVKSAPVLRSVKL